MVIFNSYVSHCRSVNKNGGQQWFLPFPGQQIQKIVEIPTVQEVVEEQEVPEVQVINKVVEVPQADEHVRNTVWEQRSSATFLAGTFRCSQISQHF